MSVAHEGVGLSGDQLGSVLLVDFKFIIIAAADKILELGYRVAHNLHFSIDDILVHAVVGNTALVIYKLS